ncbi:MAG: F0F1 ATP synthase subunit delta [Chloroflexota bacterium]
MRPNATAQRYAEAAYHVARQDGNEDQWVADMRAASEAMQNEGIAQYFRDPNNGQSEKQKTVEKVFDGVGPHMLNLIRILASRNRMHLLPLIAYNFEALHRQSQGIEEAHVTVARRLSDQEREQIQQALSRATGKRIELTSDVDENILGGIVVRIGDRLIDASVAGRLQRLRQDLTV